MPTPCSSPSLDTRKAAYSLRRAAATRQHQRHGQEDVQVRTIGRPIGGSAGGMGW
jgi:hypothetical protein